MKRIKVERTESKVIIELTVTELNTLVSQFGVSNMEEAKKLANSENLNVMKDGEVHHLYHDLYKLAKEINKGE
jgi:hypothetical protein